MRCRCCEKILSPSYIKSGDKHCSACSRAIAAGSSYSEVVSEMAEIAKDRGVTLRLERLADRHRNEEMLPCHRIGRRNSTKYATAFGQCVKDLTTKANIKMLNGGAVHATFR